MKRYEPRSKFSALAAVASVVATVATLGLGIVLPAKLVSSGDASALARARDSRPPIEVAIIPSRIDVIGVRTERTALEPNAATPQAPARRS